MSDNTSTDSGALHASGAMGGGGSQMPGFQAVDYMANNEGGPMIPGVGKGGIGEGAFAGIDQIGSAIASEGAFNKSLLEAADGSILSPAANIGAGISEVQNVNMAGNTDLQTIPTEFMPKVQGFMGTGQGHGA